MQGKFKLSIHKKVTEQMVIEHCLNLKSSGCDPSLLLFFYAFGKHWKYNKLTYYINLIKLEDDIWSKTKKS